METNNKETVRAEVIQPFRDKFDKSILYKVGQEPESEIARAENVVTRGLAEYVYPVG